MSETPYLNDYLEAKKSIDNLRVGSLWAYQYRTPFERRLARYEVLSIVNGQVMLRELDISTQFNMSVWAFKRHIKDKRIVFRGFIK